MATVNINVAAGADQPTLNALVIQVYKGIYPNIFKNSINVGQAGIASVDFDIQIAPTVTLGPSEQHSQMIREHISHELPAERLEEAVAFLTQSAITATCSQVALTVNYQNEAPPTQTVASIILGANVTTNLDGSYSITVAVSQITVNGNPILSELLTNAVGPFLATYLNTNILNHITIPSLSFLGVTLMTPVMTTENNPGGEMLVAYSGLTSPVVVPPQGTPWPTGLYNLKLQAAFSLSPGSGSAVTGTVNVSGSASVSLSCGIVPTITIGADISGTATLTAAVTAQASGSSDDIIVTIESLDNFDLHIDLPGVPWPFDDVISEFVSGFVQVIGSAVASIMSNYPIKVYTLAPITFSLGSNQYQVALSQLAVQTINGPTGPLLTVTALPLFSPQVFHAATKFAPLSVAIASSLSSNVYLIPNSIMSDPISCAVCETLLMLMANTADSSSQPELIQWPVMATYESPVGIFAASFVSETELDCFCMSFNFNISSYNSSIILVIFVLPGISKEPLEMHETIH
eukprot:Em0001g3148a